MKRRPVIIVVVVVDLILIAVVAWWFASRQKPDASTTPASVVAAPPVESSSTDPVPPPANPTNPDHPAQGALPIAPMGETVVHGTWRGEPFWMRLAATPDADGARLLEIVYTPSAPAVADGSVIHDSPKLLLDGNLRLRQWDNRDGATGVKRQADPASYLVIREVREGEEGKVRLLRRTLAVGEAWPLEVAPLLVALAWQPKASWGVQVIDFWGPRAMEALTLTSAGDSVTIAGGKFIATTDGQGRLTTLTQDGAVVLGITAWTSTAP